MAEVSHYHMAEIYFEQQKISFICPKCKRKCKTELSFAPKKEFKKLTYEKGTWCTCGAIWKLKYKLSLTRMGKIKFKVIEFISDEKKHKTRFKLLNP